MIFGLQMQCFAPFLSHFIQNSLAKDYEASHPAKQILS